MGEREVPNRYYQPDYDRSKISQPDQGKVRTALPMGLACEACGSYMCRGTKLNARKEDVIGKSYLGIQIVRFSFKCFKCSANISYTTDPEKSDYAVEFGAKRDPQLGSFDEEERLEEPIAGSRL